MSGVFSANDVDELNGDSASMGADVDVDVDMDVDQELQDPNPNQQEQQQNNKSQPPPPLVEDLPPVPALTRADKTLDELLDLLDDPDFTPIIPDAVTDYYLAKSGLSLPSNTSNAEANTEATKIKRLLALATQKFISDIATDAYEYSRVRSNTAVYTANNPQVRARALMMATMARARGTGSGGNGTGDDVTGTGATGPDDEGGDNSNISNALNPNGASQNKACLTLTMDDLSSALDEYGLNVNRSQFYR